MKEEITAVVVNYNGGSLVIDSIESILKQRGISIRVVVVDDGSTDGSPEKIEKKYPNIDIYKEEKNTRQLNRLRNKGLYASKSDKVFITDNDVILDKSCIANLAYVMDSGRGVGVCIPRLMYLNERSRVYQMGGRVHYLGTTTAPNRDIDASDAPTDPRIAVGGGIALFDVEKIEQVGGFDEDYELAWGDDGELHQRMLMAGYKCVSVPSAVGFHEFEPFSKTRSYRARGQLCNRWRFVLSHYTAGTLLLVAPMLAFYEIVQAFYYLLKGIPLLYLKGTFDAVRKVPSILERRREIQSLRAVPDKDLLTAGPIYVRTSDGISGQMVSAAVKVLSLLFSAYWFLVHPLMPSDSSS